MGAVARHHASAGSRAAKRGNAGICRLIATRSSRSARVALSSGSDVIFRFPSRIVPSSSTAGIALNSRTILRPAPGILRMSSSLAVFRLTGMKRDLCQSRRLLRADVLADLLVELREVLPRPDNRQTHEPSCCPRQDE